MYDPSTMQTDEGDQVRSLPKGSVYVTYALIAINVIVFILMVIDGAGLFAPDGLVHIKWGSNYSPLTLHGEWWRLISCCFIHFGIIHLLMNMYCLFIVGIYLEPLLGKFKFITAYLAAGLLSSLASLWYHVSGINSAGASGAIFGMFGLFLALLTTNLIPKEARSSLFRSIGIFVVYNLFYGMKGGIDNAAHIGGLLSGIVIGYIYAFAINKEKKGTPAFWAAPLIIILASGITNEYLKQMKKNEQAAKQREEYNNILKKLLQEQPSNGDSSQVAAPKEPPKDAATIAFEEQMGSFTDIENQALTLLADSKVEGNSKADQLKEEVLPLWQQADDITKKMKLLKLSHTYKLKADLLHRYILLREEEVYSLGKVYRKEPDSSEEYNLLRDRINKLMYEIQQLDE